MKPRYRTDYEGEFVLMETRFADNKKVQKREWVPNPIENQHISGRAAVIGSRDLREMFDWRIIERHRGGLLSTKKLQTYGTGDVWQDMRFDFFVSSSRERIARMLDAGYDSNTVIYASNRTVMEHPGRLYLVPFGPVLDPLALAIYLAAFDNHREIFLFGYTKETVGLSIHWAVDVNRVLQAYDETKFYLVGPRNSTPEIWRQNKNVSELSFREFVFHCDV